MLEVGLSRAQRTSFQDDIDLYMALVSEEKNISFAVRCGLSALDLMKRGYSAKFIDQPGAVFKSDVRRAIQLAGLDYDRVRKVVSRFYVGKRLSRKQYLKVIRPIYAELRQMGYSHVDLTQGSG